MMKYSLRVLFLFCLVFANIAGYCEDWPQFRGLNRDGKSLETGLQKEWLEGGLEPSSVVEKQPPDLRHVRRIGGLHNGEILPLRHGRHHSFQFPHPQGYSADDGMMVPI